MLRRPGVDQPEDQLQRRGHAQPRPALHDQGVGRHGQRAREAAL